MRITVLTVADCPHARPAVERVTAGLGGRDADVELVEVADEAEAVRRGMYGSPTVLVDGDPYMPPGAVPSLSCRLYRGDEGTVSGVPGEAALRRAFAGAAAPGPVTEAPDCCAPEPAAPLDVVGRGGRGRRAPAERGLRAVHQQVLRHFAATGAAPGVETLRGAAATAGRSAEEELAELAAEDFLTLDETGGIRAAYPFSALPTRHRVRIEGGPQVWSMCAIDALGIPAMLGKDAAISSTDPVTGAPVTVTSTAGTTHWEPRDAVVCVGQRPGGGPAAAVCCDALNFFSDAGNARTWMGRHQDVPGRILTGAEAEQTARRTFGPLLLP